MYKYVERKVEILGQPALVQDVGDVGHQVELPLTGDLLQHRRHRHVGETVAADRKLYLVFYPKPHQVKEPLMSKKRLM